MPLTDQSSSPDSPEIGAYVDGQRYEAANAYAREEISRGAEALLYRLNRQPGPEGIATLLDGIPMERVSIHCSLRYTGQDPAELFRDLILYLRRQQVDLSSVRGSVDFDPLLDWSEPPFPPLIRLLDFVDRRMPNFRVLQVNAAGFNDGPQAADREVGLALAKGTEYLRQLDQRGYSIDRAARFVQFALTLSTDPVVDAAKVRVLKSLWPKVLADFGVSTLPDTPVAAHTDLLSIAPDAATNERLIVEQTAAAVAGGADLLFLAPTLKGRAAVIETQQLQRSNPRSIKVPAATIDQLQSNAWKSYRAIQKQGGFAEATVF